MPKEVEDRLKREARKKGLKGKRAGAYVYGTLSKLFGAHKQKKSILG
jgi:hypothetical protein